MKNRTWKITNNDVLFDMLKTWNNMSTVFQPLHDEQTRNYNMTVSQLQWKPEWKAKLESEGRPANAYNLLRPVINAITSIELSNRKKLIAKPTSGGDGKLAEVITQVLLRLMHNTRFDWHRTRVLLDSIIAKFGVYYINWSYEYDPEGELTISAIDPREIVFEMNFADPTWENSAYLYRKHQMGLEEILNTFALDDDEMQNEIITQAKTFFETDTDKRSKWISKRLKALFTAVYEINMHGTNQTQANSYLNSSYLNWFDPSTGKFDVLELHEKRIERTLTVFDNNRQKNIDITEESKDDKGIGFDNQKIAAIKKKHNIDGEPRSGLDTKKFITAVIPAFNIVANEQPYPFKLKSYVYVPNYCYDWHPEAFRAQSFVDDLIDPQSDYNKARSTKLELLQRYVNKGWIMEENAITGLEKDWETNSIAPYRRVRNGYLNKIKPEEQQTISADLIRETGEAPALIETISNTGGAIRGAVQSGEKSARHFQLRRQQEEKSFSYLFNNVEHSTKTVGEVSLAIIQNRCTTERIFRITQDVPEPYNLAVNQKQIGINPQTGSVESKIVNDITIGEYDIEIDSTPYTSTAKEIEFAKLGELFDATIKIDPQKADALLPLMVKAGDYPYADQILQAWGDLQPTQQPGQDGQPQMSPQQQQIEQQQQLAQMEMQMKMIMAKLGIEEKKAQIEEIKAKTQSHLMKNAHTNQETKAKKIHNALTLIHGGSQSSNSIPKQKMGQ
jgi:hypothetical protein